MNITSDNHFVPRSYLKRWSKDGKKICHYPTLVSHDNVRMWTASSIRSVAFKKHLYTVIKDGKEIDDVEKWFDRNFEDPASEVIDKAIADQQLSPDDWEVLIRFLAAQDVRTPSRLYEILQRGDDRTQTLNESMQELVQTLAKSRTEPKAKKERPIQKTTDRDADSFGFPVSVSLSPSDEDGMVELKTSILVGRSYWVSLVKYLLTKSVHALLSHRWTILKSPAGVNWVTSDDPVLKLNYNNATNYDFGGGWGSKGTDIILPLSPKHILYTQVGYRPPRRGETMDLRYASLIKKFACEKAWRSIFAISPDPDVQQFRPRLVNAEQFNRERDMWKAWHSEQSEAEKEWKRKRDDDSIATASFLGRKR